MLAYNVCPTVRALELLTLIYGDPVRTIVAFALLLLQRGGATSSPVVARPLAVVRRCMLLRLRPLVGRPGGSVVAMSSTIVAADAITLFHHLLLIHNIPSIKYI